jgi:hypothetical protein
MAFVFTRPRAWKMMPARTSSIGSAISEGCENRRKRASNRNGSMTP